MEVWSPGTYPTDEMFLTEIVPELQSTVVQRVLDQEDAGAFQVKTFVWMMFFGSILMMTNTMELPASMYCSNIARR